MLPAPQIARDLAGASSSRERRDLVNRYAAQYGVSVQAIYKAANVAGYQSGRTTRSDAGILRINQITEAQLQAVATILHSSHSEKDRIDMPAWKAIQLAERQGIIAPGLLTPSYLNTWLRTRKVSKAETLARTPHTRLQSLHPNHVHQVDASQCAQWYLKPDGSVAHQRRSHEVYKNKSGNTTSRITRWLLIDHYSGTIFPWYTLSETTLDLIEFLYRAWADKTELLPLLDNVPQNHLPPGNLRFPFRGVPELIYSDNGSTLTSEPVRNLLAKLNITATTHRPGNPRAKGGNETMQRHWENAFESELKIFPATSLEELNARAFAFACWYNDHRRHTRHGQPRFHVWEQTAAAHMRDLPDYHFYRAQAASAPETRLVSGDGTIRFKPRSGKFPEEYSGLYRVPDVNLRGTTVEVSFCLYDFPRVKIISRKTGQIFEELPLRIHHESGFVPEISATFGQNFRSPAHTQTQAALRELHLDEAHARAQALPLAKANNPIPANPIQLPAETEVRTYSRIAAKQWLLQRLGAARMDELSPNQTAALQALPETITQPQLQTLLTELQANNILPIQEQQA